MLQTMCRLLILMGYTSLIHSCQDSSLVWIIWIYRTFENNFGIKHTFQKYLRESWWLVTDWHFPFKYFLEKAFVRELSVKESGGFWCRSHEQVSGASIMVTDCIKGKGKGIRFIVLYPPKCSHNYLPSLAGQYTRKPFQSLRDIPFISVVYHNSNH